MAVNSWLILGITYGILFTWIGFLVAILSLPMARGEVHSREYNYRPWQPGFIRSMPDEELDRLNQKGAKWVLAYALFLVVLGICSFISGATSIMNPMVLAIILTIVTVIMILSGLVYLFLYRRKASK